MAVVVEPHGLDVMLKQPLTVKLRALYKLHPTDARAIEVIVDDCLRRRWPGGQDAESD